MIRHLCIPVCVALVSSAIPLRAANRPHAGTDSETILVWTNDDLEKFHDPCLISIVGRTDEEMPASASGRPPYVKTRDAEWYAGQAAKLRDELDRRKAQLGGYRQAIEDARSLKNMTGGINLDEGDIGITPDAGIEILQQRVNETQSELASWEDLGRRNDFEPGVLRGH